MGNKFTEAERTYRTLSQSYDEGTLDAEQFAQALAALEIQDDQEQWWQIQGNGKWLRYNGEVWEEATPPRPGPPPPPRAALIPPPRRARPEPTPIATTVLPESSTSPPPLEDDSIFFQTGVPADQIPGLNDPQPAPGAFLLEENEPADQIPQPVPVKVRAQALLSTPRRPQATAVTATPPPAEVVVTPSPPPVAPAPAALPPVGTPQPVVAQVVMPAHSDAPVSAPPDAHAVSLRPALDHPTTCPKCHKQVPPGAHFCKYCGARPADTESPAPQVSAPQNCPSCHQPVLPNARFCGKCGHALAVPAVSAPSAPAACPKCHVPAVTGARFCKNCGHKLT